MEAIKASVGATKERAQHSIVIPYDVEITPEGTVVAKGQRDIQHCYLDFLLNNHLLGNDEDSMVRFLTGYKLRKLHYKCHTSGASCIKEMGANDKIQSTTAEDTPAEIAFERYHRIMKALPPKYRNIIEIVCTGNLPMVKGSKREHELIIDGLDALWGAFRRI